MADSADPKFKSGKCVELITGGPTDQDVDYGLKPNSKFVEMCLAMREYIGRGGRNRESREFVRPLHGLAHSATP